MSSIYKVAKKYLKAGLSIAPASRKTKHPNIRWKSLQTTPLTQADLKIHFLDQGDLDIALITGSLSGVMVVDADSPDAVKWCDKKLPKTITQDTKHGRHYFYQSVKDVRSKVDYFNEKKAGGRVVDIRGESGIIMLAPSANKVMNPDKLTKAIKAGSLPDFPAELFPESKRTKTTRKKARKKAKKLVGVYLDGEKKTDLLDHLNLIPPDCNYKAWMEIGSALSTCFNSAGFEKFCDWSWGSKEHDWSEGELAGFWDSLEPGYHSHKTIFHYASKIGINPDILSAAEFANTFSVKADYIMECKEAVMLYTGLLMERQVTVIIAPPNGGKSAIFFYLIAPELADADKIVYYIDVDSAGSDHFLMAEFAKRKGFHWLNPDTNRGESAESLLKKLP